MSLKEYLRGIKGKRLAILGIGVSNTPLIKIMLENGVSVMACDKKTRSQLGAIADELESLGAELRLGPGYLEGLDADIIFRTPGMHPDNPALTAAREAGAEITSEMEVFFRLCPCKKIAVTGSDGKTTTTSVIYELLKKAGYRVHVGGNIGKPLLPEVDDMTPSDIAVLELSSFQLMTMNRSPEIAVITNLAPNHLDIHKSMEEYVSAKENIYLHQDAGGVLVLNLDNDITKGFAPKAKGCVRYFSRKSLPENGVFLDGENHIVRVRDGEQSTLMSAGEIFLRGIHNVENYMAAIASTDGMVSAEDIKYVANHFQGVAHRIEFVREKDGVRYYNDSMSSSPSRTIAGLNSFKEKVILVAGGYDKHIPYDVLGPVILAHVKTMVLTGDTAPKIRQAVEAAEGYRPEAIGIIMEEDFETAVRKASALAKNGDVVILSPASASFDKFKDFADRGDTFKRIVNSL